MAVLQLCFWGVDVSCRLHKENTTIAMMLLTISLRSGIQPWTMSMASKHVGPANPADLVSFSSEWCRLAEAKVTKLPSLTMAQPRDRLVELHTRQPLRDGRYGARIKSKGGIHCSDPLSSHVLFHLGDLPYAHLVPRVLQRTYW